MLIFAVLWTLQMPPDVIQRSSTGESAVIHMVRKTPRSGYEGIVRLNDKSDKNLCIVDYSSEDGNHGYVVEHSKRTADGRFFVWSLSSSGGHQPWHNPTMFFDTKTGRIRLLDDSVKGPGITNTEFELVGKDEIKVDVYPAQRSEEVSTMRLSLLRIAESKGSKVWSCARGVTIRP